MEEEMSLQINDRLFWPQGRTKAVTFSYDDGVSQDARLIEFFNRYGVKGTFNLNSGLSGSPGTISAGGKTVRHDKLPDRDMIRIYAGHEPASHGLFHSCLYGMDVARCTREILDCRAQLETIFRVPLTGFAYAFGACSDTIKSALVSCGIAYARTIRSTRSFDIPQDFLLWDPTCHHDDVQLFSLADRFLSDEPFFSFFSPAKLFSIWGHSYEFDQNDNWDRMDSFLQKISGHSDIWYATNGEICAYVSAFRSLIFSVDSRFVYNPTAVPVWLGGMFGREPVRADPGQCKTLIPPVEI